MSLLLEALKKAELAKQNQSVQPAPADAGAMRLEPVITRESLPDINPSIEISAEDIPPAPEQRPVPEAQPVEAALDPVTPRDGDMPLLDPPDQQTAASGGFSPFEREAGLPSGDAGRDAARQLFDVKEVDYNPRRPFYITLGILGLSAAGYGGYLWWELQPKSLVNTRAVAAPAKAAPEAAPGPSAASAAAPSVAGDGAATPGPGQAGPIPAPESTATQPVPPSPSPAPPGAAATNPPAASAGQTGPAQGAPVAGPPPSVAPVPPAPAGVAKPPATAQKPAAPGPAIPAPVRAAPPAGPAAQAPSAGARAPARPPIKITPPSVEPDELLERAYAAYQRGDFGTARDNYLQVLRREASNRDALLGMAAIELREGELELAEARYSRLLELDPRDAHARAGLLALRGAADPGQNESRLKSLIAQQPESGPLHFTLGNAYASQRRWAEAQEAYFRAHTLEPENPDFAFNLAISLDQMRQPRLALDYYRRAVSLAEKRPAAFNPAAALARIRELER